MNLNLSNVLRAGLALGSVSLSADFLVDFDAPGDFTGGFAGYTDFGELTSGGLGDSGAVMLSPNSQIAVQQATIELSAGGAHRLYAYFRYNGASSTRRGFIVGFTDGAGDTYQSSATSTGLDLRVVVAGAGTDDLYGLQILNNGVSVDASLLNATLVDGNWYYLELEVGAVADGELTGVAAYLYEADADGVVGTALKSLNASGAGGYNVTTALAGATVYPFFGGQNSSDVIASVADNFGYSFEPDPVVLPETTVNYGRPEALDGTIEAAWADQPMNILSVDIDGTAPEASDLSGYWQAMWDEDYLYFLLVTEDDTVVTWPGSQFWNNDMTELFLDMDYSRNDDVQRYDENDSQTVFPRDGQAPFGSGDSPFSFPIANFAQAADGTSTVVEFALPWSELGVVPSNGMPFGIDVYMKDTDLGEGRENQISWSPSEDQAWRHPALFGTATLAGGPVSTTIGYGTPEAVDGTIEDLWSAQPVNVLGVDIDGTAPESSNLSGYWQSMWDDNYLYFLLVTEDDTLVTWPGSQFWNNDMTELFLDMDYSRNDGVERYDANDSQTVFPRDGQEPFTNGVSPFSFPLASFAQVTDGSTTVVEVAFSWDELLVSPFIGMPLGVDVYMKDTDAGAGRENQISWSPSRDQAWRHPALFGTARLTGEVNSPTGYAAAGAPLAIDGVTDAGWDAAISHDLTVDIDGSAPAPENLSGSWSAMWDESYLYFLIVTVDDSVIVWPGAQFWNWDMTELFLDGDYSRNGQEARYDANDSQTIFPRDGQEVFGNGLNPFTFPLANFAQVTDGAITTTEFALPWSELGVTPYAGRPLGLDVYIKDSDLGEGRENQLAWSPSRDQAWRHPALFGTLILGDGFAEGLAPLLQAAPQAGATYRSTWFGEFFQAGDWINHDQLGWLYTGEVTSEDDLLMWSYSMGTYIWTTRDFFPVVYDYARAAWIYYVILEDGSAAVYDLSLGAWVEGVE